MNKEIENPFLEGFTDCWVSGIKVLKWRYDNFVKKDMGKWGQWGHKYPLDQMPKWEVKNQKVFATNLQLLFEEIAINLDECKAAAEPDLERYIVSLLQPFKEYTDIMHSDNLRRFGELSFEYWAGFNSWVFDEIQRAKAPEPPTNDAPEPQPQENDYWLYCGCVYTMSNLFGVAYVYANMLDAVLLERGFDLLSIQRQVGITLLSRRDLIQLGHYLGTPERAKDLISRVAPEPEPPQPQQRQAYNGQPEKSPEPQPEPQQKQPKPTRGRGRPKETFKDKMIDDANGEKLQKIHTKLDGKKGKDASLIVLACIKKGWMTRPTYTQVKNEFGDIGSKTGYNKYLNENMFAKEELEGAVNSLD